MNVSSAKLLGAFLVIVLRAFSATLVYQPSPYKGTDLWITNQYSYNDDYGVNDGKLVVGGWGDSYRSALKFDLEGLPNNPTRVVLALYVYSPSGGATVVDMTAYAVTNFWDESSGWYNIAWFGYNYGTIGAPTPNKWNGIGITNLYKNWKSGALTNHGLMFVPNATNNRFNYFMSSDYSSPQYRPYLYIEYNETVTPPNFKLPLPGGRKWVVTTEIGGKDAKYPNPFTPQGVKDENHIDTAHIDHNYFSIDFGASSSPQYVGEIPILAAAAGKVYFAGGSEYIDNGYYVVIDHDYDNNISTGYSTRYLHFKYLPLVKSGEVVSQGQILGYMGNTGKSRGTHLHFGIRYQNSGDSHIDALTFVKLEGLHMKQYQTEVDANGNRVINSYFQSTNTP